MIRWPFSLLMFFVVACSEKTDVGTESDAVASESVGDPADASDDPEDESDTDADADADAEEVVCVGVVEDIDPKAEDEETSWFYSDSIEVEFEGLHPDDVPLISLVDSAGTDVPFETNWIPESTIALVDGDLTGNETYTLTVTCANELSTTFGTSAFGASLEGANAELLGKVYELEMETANFAEPPDVGVFLASYLKDVLLTKVVEVTDDELTLKVAQARPNDVGVLEQDCDLATYEFPASDFTDAPFFASSADSLVINWDGGGELVPISLYGMRLEGTIAPDGSAMGGAWIGGMLDTSNLGPLLSISGLGMDIGEGDSSVCDMAEVLGLDVNCEPCAESNYCLYVEIHFEESIQSEVDMDETPGDADGTCPEVPDDGTEG